MTATSLGADVGRRVGDHDGESDGDQVGDTDGTKVGAIVLGALVGESVGEDVGDVVGVKYMDGAKDIGESVGESVGISVPMKMNCWPYFSLHGSSFAIAPALMSTRPLITLSLLLHTRVVQNEIHFPGDCADRIYRPSNINRAALSSCTSFKSKLIARLGLAVDTMKVPLTLENPTRNSFDTSSPSGLSIFNCIGMPRIRDVGPGETPIQCVGSTYTHSIVICDTQYEWIT